MAFLCHEIRNPLFAITSTASFLDDTEMTEEQEIGAGSIFDSALLMLRIVNDVLDLSIIGEGKMELEERDFDLHQLLENLVFMDLSMPVMDGYEATEEIQQHEQEANSNSSNSSNSNSNNEVPVHIPSIALTANALTKERDHALESGAHEFHTKPILRNDLHSICARYLETSASSTAAASIASCNSTSLGNMLLGGGTIPNTNSPPPFTPPPPLGNSLPSRGDIRIRGIEAEEIQRDVAYIM